MACRYLSNFFMRVIFLVVSLAFVCAPVSAMQQVQGVVARIRAAGQVLFGDQGAGAAAQEVVQGQYCAQCHSVKRIRNLYRLPCGHTFCWDCVRAHEGRGTKCLDAQCQGPRADIRDVAIAFAAAQAQPDIDEAVQFVPAQQEVHQVPCAHCNQERNVEDLCVMACGHILCGNCLRDAVVRDVESGQDAVCCVPGCQFQIDEEIIQHIAPEYVEAIV